MNKELNIKRIPYGVTDFHKFREANYYYIDKTRFIRKIEEKGRYLFLIRPRRFGKSLFLNILDVYYDITQADQFDYYFQGTNIHQNPTKERNTYLILKLNFSKVDPNPALVEAAFLQTIINTACFFVRKYQKYLDMDIDKAIAQFESQKSPAVVMDMLLTMCQDKAQQLYIIIDEYDNFANIILSEAGETEFQKLTHGSGQLRSFFNVLKAGTTDANAPISRLFITGVSPITLDDVTSGFNIASNISLDADINDIHGFTRPEVEEMIEYYRQTGKILHGTTELMEIMSRWYNHYRFSTRSQQDLYNTFHVLYFLQEYMKYSQIPGILVDENALIDYQKLRQLILIDQQGTNTLNGNFSQLREIMETGILYSDISRSFPVEALMETRNFISLLYYFGLLTITGVDEENKAILKIPNESIRRLYYDYIKSIYEETGTFSIRLHEYQPLMKDMAFNGHW